MKNKTIKQLETRIAQIKNEIVGLGDIRPGALSEQVRTCRGKTYGTSWSLNYTFKGRHHTDYVAARALESVQGEVANFKRLRELIEEWTELAIELSKLRIQVARDNS
jgi:hypothetical protein